MSRMQGIIKNLKRLLLVAVAAAAIATALTWHIPRPVLAPRDGPTLADAHVWGYQLQQASPARIAAPIDVLVIDYARGSKPTETLSAAEVQRFRTRPDGTKRIVLAYLSIGEAENYRFYWWPHWRNKPPSWLSDENPEWKGNYRVRYWEPGWRNVMINARPTLLDHALESLISWRKPYLDRIIEAGFDGVYLDRVDAFMEWQKSRPSAEADMIALVTDLSAHAKARSPGFLVVPQNGEELLAHPDFRRHIDAAAKEDLWYGVDGAEQPNGARDVSRSLSFLNRMRADGKPVLVVEYLDDATKRDTAKRQAADRGYVLTFAARQLDKSPEVVEQTTPPPTQVPPSQAPPSQGTSPTTPQAAFPVPSRPLAPQPARPKQ